MLTPVGIRSDGAFQTLLFYRLRVHRAFACTEKVSKTSKSSLTDRTTGSSSERSTYLQKRTDQIKLRSTAREALTCSCIALMRRFAVLTIVKRMSNTKRNTCRLAENVHASSRFLSCCTRVANETVPQTKSRINSMSFLFLQVQLQGVISFLFLFHSTRPIRQRTK